MVDSTTEHYSNESGEPSEHTVTTDDGEEFVFQITNDGEHDPVDDDAMDVPETVEEHLLDEYGAGVTGYGPDEAEPDF
jgi:hypothetical protein